MNHLQKVFRYDQAEIRTIIKKDEVWFIANESGLYTLILTSRKIEAKQFKRWISLLREERHFDY